MIMGTKMFPEMSVVFNELTRLVAREQFIKAFLLSTLSALLNKRSCLSAVAICWP
jgi:hypothetical protein